MEDGLIRQTRSKNPGVTQKRRVKKNKPTGTKPVSWEKRGKWKPTPETQKKAEELRSLKKIAASKAESAKSISQHAEKAKELRKLKTKRIKNLKQGGMITAGTLGAAGLIYGGKKLYNKIKINKKLQEYRKQFDTQKNQTKI